MKESASRWENVWVFLSMGESEMPLAPELACIISSSNKASNLIVSFYGQHFKYCCLCLQKCHWTCCKRRFGNFWGQLFQRAPQKLKISMEISSILYISWTEGYPHKNLDFMLINFCDTLLCLWSQWRKKQCNSWKGLLHRLKNHIYCPWCWSLLQDQITIYLIRHYLRLPRFCRLSKHLLMKISGACIYSCFS